MFMFKSLTILSCLMLGSGWCPVTILANPTIAPTQDIESFYIDGAPEWVTPYQPSLEYILPNTLDVNFQCLLIDHQDNWLEKATYTHAAVKPLTILGIEGNSQVTIGFDPAYQKAIVHSIQVYRDGQWLDRLECSRYELIQDKDPSGNSSYTGAVSLVYFLNDIRLGDIIDYSFTIVGEKPILNSHYSHLIALEVRHPSAQISYSLLAPSDFSLSLKPFNTDLKPLIEEISPSLKKWSWVVKNTEGFLTEEATPFWYDSSAYVACSQYESWDEVSHLVSALYVLPDTFEESVPDEMASLVEEWQNKTADVQERALLACRFVQDEIRYLCFTDDTRGLQPEKPEVVLKNRFGDCKGKSLLLHALLRLMKIESHPVLVHPSRGKAILENLPSPILFNHCVIQIKIGDTTYWVDPTITLQGGSLETNFYPDYAYGLLLLKNSDTLVSIPSFQMSKPTELQTSITFLSEEDALIEESAIFYGQEADYQRMKVAQNGLDALEQESLTEIQKIYGEAEVVSSLSFEDLRDNNVCTFRFSYQVHTEHLSNKTLLEVKSAAITNYLDSRISPVRKSPYQLVNCYWIKERIHVENPFNAWAPSEAQLHHEHPSLTFTQSMNRSSHFLDYDIEIKQLKDHVLIEDLKSYWMIVKDIKRQAPSVIEIPD